MKPTPIKFTKLHLTDKLLTREDFLNQTHKLFVLADNIPDYRLPRHKLHQTGARGGIAAAMRPNKIGGTESNPIYDVYVVGVPSISFKAGEPLTVATIDDAFANIYRVIGQDKSRKYGKNQFSEIVVPYKNGKPAIGGGIAGKLPAEIEQKIELEFKRLEQMISHKISFSSLPPHLKQALREGLENNPPSKENNIFQKAAFGLGLIASSLSLLFHPSIAAVIGLSSLSLAAISASMILGCAFGLYKSIQVDPPIQPKAAPKADSKKQGSAILHGHKRAKGAAKKVAFADEAVVRTSVRQDDGKRAFKHKRVKLK